MTSYLSESQMTNFQFTFEANSVVLLFTKNNRHHLMVTNQCVHLSTLPSTPPPGLHHPSKQPPFFALPQSHQSKVCHKKVCSRSIPDTLTHDLYILFYICIWDQKVFLPHQPRPFPNILLHFPNRLLHFPNTVSHFPNTVSHFPNTFCVTLPNIE